MRASIEARAPAPSAIITMTAATPMMMPSAVSAERITLRRSASTRCPACCERSTCCPLRLKAATRCNRCSARLKAAPSFVNRRLNCRDGHPARRDARNDGVNGELDAAGGRLRGVGGLRDRSRPARLRRVAHPRAPPRCRPTARCEPARGRSVPFTNCQTAARLAGAARPRRLRVARSALGSPIRRPVRRRLGTTHRCQEIRDWA